MKFFTLLGLIDQLKWVRAGFLLAIYIGLPIVGSLLFFAYDVNVPNDALPLVVSVFSIVSALLFGALFSIFSIVSSMDRTKLSREFKNMASFKRQVRSINRTVIYLVGLSAVCVIVALFFFLIGINTSVETFILTFLVVHFFSVFFPLLRKIFDVLELAYRKI